MCYDYPQVEKLRVIVTTIPTEALKLIAQTRTSEINLRCTCLDELRLRALSQTLEEAVKERNWIEGVLDGCGKRSDMWWHAEEHRFRMQRHVDRLKRRALEQAETDERIQYIEDL